MNFTIESKITTKRRLQRRGGVKKDGKRYGSSSIYIPNMMLPDWLNKWLNERSSPKLKTTFTKLVGEDGTTIVRIEIEIPPEPPREED